MGLQWSSRSCIIWVGGLSIVYSVVLCPLPLFMEFRTNNLPALKWGCLPCPMYLALVIVHLPTCWDPLRLLQEDYTHSLFCAGTKYLFPLAAIGVQQEGSSVLHKTVTVLFSRNVHTFSLSLCHWCPFQATSPPELAFITFVPHHGTHSVHEKLSLLFSSPLYPLTILPVVGWVSGPSRVLHMNQCILWLPAKIDTFHLGFFVPAASGCPEMCLSAAISLCMVLQVWAQYMVHMLYHFSFIAALVSPLFTHKFASIVACWTFSWFGWVTTSPHGCYVRA